MQIVPVLDMLGGQIVRGVAGRREEYRPIVSTLTDSSEPLQVARAIRDHFNLSLFYVADLDAIGGDAPDIAIYRRLQSDGFNLWIDAGIQSAENAEPLAEANASGIIAGLETLAGPEDLSRLRNQYGGDRVIFSLDLKNGVPVKSADSWPTNDPIDIARRAIDLGIEQMIVLDLAQVGMNGGTGTERLCASLIQTFPGVSFCTGGGVRHWQDLLRLKEIGVHSVLVASALHDGKLTRDQLEEVA